jgi:hypothetical protein
VLPAETPLCEGQNSSDVTGLVLPAHTACHMQRKKLASCHAVGDLPHIVIIFLWGVESDAASLVLPAETTPRENYLFHQDS